MVSLTLRNIPEELLKRIKIFASGSRRSMNSELLVILEEGIASRTSKGITTTANGLSPAGREKIWTELCGEWKDSRKTQAVIEQVYTLRDGTGEVIS